MIFLVQIQFIYLQLNNAVASEQFMVILPETLHRILLNDPEANSKKSPNYQHISYVIAYRHVVV